MSKLRDEGGPQDRSDSLGRSRRDFLKVSTATGVAAAGLNLFGARPAAANDGDDPPRDSGRPGRRYVIRGGHVMSMDPKVGDFVKADVLVEGKKILAVRPNIHASGAGEIDAGGHIVMPGFVDTHHHQFETALRSFLADGLLFNDGQPHGVINYFEYILGKFAPVYRPQDVYINELFSGLSQIDCGVTTVHVILLDAEAINVTPLNVVPGAVVSLMERSNVETVIVAGKVLKWKGQLLDVDLRKLRRELEDSRDYLFAAAGIPQDLFRPN